MDIENKLKKRRASFLIILALLLCGCSNHSHTKQKEIDSQEKYIHISFDDVAYCMNNIVKNNYDSIWDEPFFSWLKYLHETYGAKFSLYCFLDENFLAVSDEYKEELVITCDWLKFGLHSESIDRKYEKSTYDDGFNEWNAFCSNVITMTGNEESIDRIPRLNYFAGSYEVLCGMRDADYGAIGFLTADDDRNSYNLNEEQNKYLLDYDYIYDSEMGLYYYGTDMRGDWFAKNFSTSNKYNVPTKKDVYEELECRYTDVNYEKDISHYIWFCHEWQIYNGKLLNENKCWVEDACKFAYDYNIEFSYPQDNLIVE